MLSGMGWDWDSFKRTLAYAGRVIPKALAEAAADLWGTPLKAIVFFAILLAGLVAWSAFGQEAPVLAWIGAGVTAGLLGLAFSWKLFTIPARLTDGRNLIVLSSDQLMGRQIAAEFGEAYERLKPLYKATRSHKTISRCFASTCFKFGWRETSLSNG